MPELHSFRFPVGERPVAFWDFEMKKRNLSFLEGIDPAYYQYVAQTHFDTTKDADEELLPTRSGSNAAASRKAFISSIQENCRVS